MGARYMPGSQAATLLLDWRVCSLYGRHRFDARPYFCPG